MLLSRQLVPCSWIQSPGGCMGLVAWRPNWPERETQSETQCPTQSSSVMSRITCKETCVRSRAPQGPVDRWYQDGQKRQDQCGIFVGLETGSRAARGPSVPLAAQLQRPMRSWDTPPAIHILEDVPNMWPAAYPEPLLPAGRPEIAPWQARYYPICPCTTRKRLWQCKSWLRLL